MVSKEVELKENVLDCDRIQGFGVSSFVYPLMISCFLGMGTNIIYNLAKVDSYISVIIGSIIGIIPLMLIIYIIKNSNGDDIVDLNLKLFGAKIGTVFNILLNIFAILFASLILYNITIFLDVEYIPDTNPLYVKIIVLMPIIYAISKNIAVISRLSQMVLIVGFILFILSVLGLVGGMKIENLQPFLSNGLTNPIKAGFLYAVFAVLPLFFLVVIPRKYEEKGQNTIRRIVIMYIIMNVIIFSMFFITTAVLGYGMISVFKHPEYMVLKGISILSVIERIESTLALQFLFSMTMSIVVLLYLVVRSCRKIFPSLKAQQIIPYILGLVTLLISYYMFPNSMSASYFVENYVPYILTAVILSMVLILSITIFIRNINERKNHSSLNQSKMNIE